MKISVAELKKALDRLDKDRGGTIVEIRDYMERHLEIIYSTDEQEVKIILYPEESHKFPEILKKERL